MDAKQRLSDAQETVDSLTNSTVTVARILGVTPTDFANALVDKNEEQADYLADLVVAMVKAKKDAEKAEDEKPSKKK